MRLKTCLLASMAGLAVAGAANATVYFTYDDPFGPAKELQYTEGNAMMDGHISYSSAVPFQFVVDGTDEGLGTTTIDAAIIMDVDVGTATPGAGGSFSASVTGTFEVRDFNTNELLLDGVITNGAVLTFSSTGGLLATSTNNSLTMSAHGSLLAFLGGLQLEPQMDVAWSLSDISPTVVGTNAWGYFESFNANTAFVGNAERVPSPGAASLLAAAGLVTLPRRRRA